LVLQAGVGGAAAGGGSFTIVGGLAGGAGGAAGSITWQVGLTGAANVAASALSLSGGSGNLTFFNNANFIPSADNTCNIGTDAARFARIRAAVIVSGDLGFDDPSCPKCGLPFFEGQELTLVVKTKNGIVSQCVPAHRTC
jgi:hypothetical protein